jgi:hypothetical protein
MPIHLREIGADRHGVHQVVSRVHASESEAQRRLIEAVTLDDLRRRLGCPDPFGIPRQAPHRPAGLFEMSKKTAADVPRRAGEEDWCVHASAYSSFGRMTLSIT